MWGWLYGGWGLYGVGKNKNIGLLLFILGLGSFVWGVTVWGLTVWGWLYVSGCMGGGCMGVAAWGIGCMGGGCMGGGAVWGWMYVVVVWGGAAWGGWFGAGGWEEINYLPMIFIIYSIIHPIIYSFIWGQ